MIWIPQRQGKVDIVHLHRRNRSRPPLRSTKDERVVIPAVQFPRWVLDCKLHVPKIKPMAESEMSVLNFISNVIKRGRYISKCCQLDFNLNMYTMSSCFCVVFIFEISTRLRLT